MSTDVRTTVTLELDSTDIEAMEASWGSEWREVMRRRAEDTLEQLIDEARGLAVHKVYVETCKELGIEPVPFGDTKPGRRIR